MAMLRKQNIPVVHTLSVGLSILLGLLCPITQAASSANDLKQLTVLLQKNPADTTLREKIIKLARTITPAPAVPEEAQRRLGRGQAAFETAKEPKDFADAITEFQLAANAAPWLPAPYYNLGVAQEKAKKYREAMGSFKLYLLAAPMARDAGDVKQRLFKLEYLAEKPAQDRIDLGGRYNLQGSSYDDKYYEFEVNGTTITKWMVWAKDVRAMEGGFIGRRGERVKGWSGQLNGRSFVATGYHQRHGNISMEGRISDDNRTLSVREYYVAGADSERLERVNSIYIRQ